MSKIEYPKWVYHPARAPVLVNGPDEHAALGPEWVESPAEARPAEASAASDATDAADAPTAAAVPRKARKR